MRVQWAEGRAKGLRRRIGAAAGAVLVTFGGIGCSTGLMNVDEQFYLSARNDLGQTNYYRVTIDGVTTWSDAKFRQGWFPAEAVDAVFGDVSADDDGQKLSTRAKLRAQLDDAFVKAQEEYLAVALQEKQNPEALKQRLEAFNRIRQLPGAGENSQVRYAEYNPREGIELSRLGQKPVMILSADPDEVINKIVNVAEDAKTQELWAGISEVLQARERAQAAGDQARLDARSASQAATAAYLRQVVIELKDAGAKNPTSRAELLAKLEAVMAQLRSAP